MQSELKNLAGDDKDLSLLVSTGAVKEGHFKLASGRHSSVYFQCARAFVDTKVGNILASRLAERVRHDIDDEIELCIAPAIGGIVVGYEMARQLECKSIFFERRDGVFVLRRGFEIPKGIRTLVVEDVVTTGGSLISCINIARSLGANVIGACSLLQRITDDLEPEFDTPYTKLIAVEAPSFHPDALPPEFADIPISIPGSSAKLVQ